jgi:hypothetical protein
MKAKSNLFYIPLAVISFIVLLLDKAGPFVGQLRIVGFVLFTILCVGLIIHNKGSKAKILGVIIFYLILGVANFF